MFIPSTSPIDLTGINNTYYGNIQYSKTNKEKLDIFIPTDAVTPTGVVMYFHGGGFATGGKDSYYSVGEPFIQLMLNNNIAFINCNYDLNDYNQEVKGVISSLTSTRDALQFIKFYSNFLNLDKNNFLIKGGSAGAGIAMWLGYQSDLIDIGSGNLFRQESTLVKAISIDKPQASYDLIKWETDVYTDLNYNLILDYNTNPAGADNLNRFYGIEDISELYDVGFIPYRNSVDMLDFISITGGIPTYLINTNALATALVSNTVPDINHDPRHGKTIYDLLISATTEIVTQMPSYGINDLETQDDFILRQLNS